MFRNVEFFRAGFDTVPAFFLAVLAFLPGLASATDSFQFVDVTSAAGLTTFTPSMGMMTGAAVADFDNDGDPDIFIPTEFGTPDRLYRNDAGTFVEIAAVAGVDGMNRGRAALWADFDGDGLLDLLVMGDCFGSSPGFPPPVGMTCPAPPIRLYRQSSPGLFTEQAALAGLAGVFTSTTGTHLGGLAAGDVNNDGYLDLFISRWDGEPWLFLNNGDGTFSDASATSGILTGGAYRGWSATIFDFNGDGRREIFHNVDFGPNRLLLNQGGATFADVSSEVGTDSAYHEMGITVSDVDNDGDFDLYMTNIDFFLSGEHNVLLRNDSPAGGLAFVDIGISSGVGLTDWGWGTTFLDADRDGFVDLAVTNGFKGYAPDPSVRAACIYFPPRYGPPSGA